MCETASMIIQSALELTASMDEHVWNKTELDAIAEAYANPSAEQVLHLSHIQMSLHCTDESSRSAQRAKGNHE